MTSSNMKYVHVVQFSILSLLIRDLVYIHRCFVCLKLLVYIRCQASHLPKQQTHKHVQPHHRCIEHDMYILIWSNIEVTMVRHYDLVQRVVECQYVKLRNTRPWSWYNISLNVIKTCLFCQVDHAHNIRLIRLAAICSPNCAQVNTMGYIADVSRLLSGVWKFSLPLLGLDVFEKGDQNLFLGQDQGRPLTHCRKELLKNVYIIYIYI